MARWRRALAAGLVLGVAASAAGGATFSAFTGTTANSASSLRAGTVRLADDDTSPMYDDLTGLTPSSPPAERCIRVSHTGSLPSTVRLYATATGTLPQYLQVRVVRGTISNPSFPSCTSFAPDAADHRGLGSGVVYDGTLAGLGSTYATGLVDPAPGAPESWTAGEQHAYRFVVSVVDDPAAAGRTSDAAFVWEARSE